MNKTQSVLQSIDPDTDFREVTSCRSRRALLPLPKLATEPFLKLWEQEVFALLLAEGKITEEVVQNIRSWKHSGFSVDQSVGLEAGDWEVTQHIPDTGDHLIRYCGWYSNKSRGQRAQRQTPAASANAASAKPPTAREARKGWAALILAGLRA